MSQKKKDFLSVLAYKNSRKKNSRNILLIEKRDAKNHPTYIEDNKKNYNLSSPYILSVLDKKAYTLDKLEEYYNWFLPYCFNCKAAWFNYHYEKATEFIWFLFGHWYDQEDYQKVHDAGFGQILDAVIKAPEIQQWDFLVQEIKESKSLGYEQFEYIEMVRQEKFNRHINVLCHDINYFIELVKFKKPLQLRKAKVKDQSLHLINWINQGNQGIIDLRYRQDMHLFFIEDWDKNLKNNDLTPDEMARLFQTLDDEKEELFSDLLWDNSLFFHLYHTEDIQDLKSEEKIKTQEQNYLYQHKANHDRSIWWIPSQNRFQIWRMKKRRTQTVSEDVNIDVNPQDQKENYPLISLLIQMYFLLRYTPDEKKRTTWAEEKKVLFEESEEKYRQGLQNFARFLRHRFDLQSDIKKKKEAKETKEEKKHEQEPMFEVKDVETDLKSVEDLWSLEKLNQWVVKEDRIENWKLEDLKVEELFPSQLEKPNRHPTFRITYAEDKELLKLRVVAKMDLATNIQVYNEFRIPYILPIKVKNYPENKKMTGKRRKAINFDFPQVRTIARIHFSPVQKEQKAWEIFNSFLNLQNSNIEQKNKPKSQEQMSTYIQRVLAMKPNQKVEDKDFWIYILVQNWKPKMKNMYDLVKEEKEILESKQNNPSFLIKKEQTFFQKLIRTIEELNNYNLSHNDLHRGNIFYQESKNDFTIILVDFGDARDTSFERKHPVFKYWMEVKSLQNLSNNGINDIYVPKLGSAVNLLKSNDLWNFGVLLIDYVILIHTKNKKHPTFYNVLDAIFTNKDPEQKIPLRASNDWHSTIRAYQKVSVNYFKAKENKNEMKELIEGFKDNPNTEEYWTRLSNPLEKLLVQTFLVSYTKKQLQSLPELQTLRQSGSYEKTIVYKQLFGSREALNLWQTNIIGQYVTNEKIELFKITMQKLLGDVWTNINLQKILNHCFTWTDSEDQSEYDEIFTLLQTF